MTQAIQKLLVSKKFLNWNKPPDKMKPEDPAFAMDEKHFTVQELAEMWGVSVQTIRQMFEEEDGVLKVGRDGTRTRRRYKTLRIPYSVAERVHTRLSS